MTFQPGSGCLTQAQPGTSCKADGKSIWILFTETDPSGLCGLCKGSSGPDVEGLVKERGRAELWEPGGAAAECWGVQQEQLCRYRGALGLWWAELLHCH